MVDHSLLDNISSGVIFIGKDKKIKYINPAARKLLNKKEGDNCEGSFEICKKCPVDNLNQEQIETFDTKLSCCQKTVCFSIKPVYNTEGKIEGYIEEIRDSTKISEYIKQIKTEKEFNRIILESVIDAILVVDEEGNIVEYNQVAKDIVCKEAEEIKGMNIKLLLNKSISDIPPQRDDVFIETPALGKIKVSIVANKLKNSNMKVISFYVVPECMLSENTIKTSRITSKNPKMQYIIETLRIVADTSATILLEGESGTGKSILAKYVHNISSRRNKPFIKINCAAIPDNLLEAELFGYMKGAFTGAIKDKPGKAELADGGTLFLDEIGEMPVYLQSKLLHLLQDKEFERIGDTKSRKVDVRIIAATNQNLQTLVKEGKFREDLYYRLKVISIKVPPLRERKEDIPFLINFFIENFSQNYKKKIVGIEPEAVKILLNYDYPGNIRELENIIERAVILCNGKHIKIENLPEELLDKTEQKFSEFTNSDTREYLSEKELIIDILKKCNGNKSKAAKILGMDRVTLWRKIKKYGIYF